MTYDEYEYEKYMEEWHSKEKAAGREIFEIIKKYNLSAGETKTLLKDLKKVISHGAEITDKTLAAWEEDNVITG